MVDNKIQPSRFVAEASDVQMLGRHIRTVDLLSDEERAENDLSDWTLDNDYGTAPRKDEHYVIDICDRILRIKADRQHRFPFLLGDVGKSGRQARLPVDAYYAGLQLVIEYHELQHDRAVSHFDKPDKLTVSGVHRGLQRKRYDTLRQAVLPANNLRLVVISHQSFDCKATGRLKRSPADYAAVRRCLIGAGVDLGY